MEQIEDANAGASARQRVVRSPTQWRELVEAHRSSGLGVGAYCRQHGVTSSCFYRWRRFLRGPTGASSPPWADNKRRRAPALDGFASVRVVPNAGEPPAPGCSISESIRLMLAGGREMILPASMPIGRLVELAVALEHAS